MSRGIKSTSKFSVFDLEVPILAPSTPNRTPIAAPQRPVKTPKTVDAEDDKSNIEKAIPAQLNLFKDDDIDGKLVADGNAKKEQVVTPWAVESEGAVDYDKLIRDFGCHALTKGIYLYP